MQVKIVWKIIAFGIVFAVYQKLIKKIKGRIYLRKARGATLCKDFAISTSNAGKNRKSQSLKI